MKTLLIFISAVIFGILGAIIGVVMSSGTSVALPGLGLIIAGSLIGAVTGFIVGVLIGTAIGYILGDRIVKSA